MTDTLRLLREKISEASRRKQNALLGELLSVYLAMQPSDVSRSYLYGETLRQLGRIEEAERVLLSLDNVPSERRHLAHISLALIYEDTGKMAEAERRYRLATEAAPASTVPWVYLGGFLAVVGRTSEAVAVLERGLAASGDLDEVHLNLGNCRRAQRDYVGAREEYVAALRISPDYAKAKDLLDDVERAMYVASPMMHAGRAQIARPEMPDPGPAEAEGGNER